MVLYLPIFFRVKPRTPYGHTGYFVFDLLCFWVVCRDTCIRAKKYRIWISERLCDVFVRGGGNMSASWERKMETVLLEKGQVKSILHRCVCLVRIFRMRSCWQ